MSTSITLDRQWLSVWRTGTIGLSVVPTSVALATISPGSALGALAVGALAAIIRAIVTEDPAGHARINRKCAAYAGWGAGAALATQGSSLLVGGALTALMVIVVGSTGVALALLSRGGAKAGRDGVLPDLAGLDRISELSDADLCRLWRVSTTGLASASRQPEEMHHIGLVRQHLLDEFERRSPARFSGFAALLLTRSDADPRPYLGSPAPTDQPGRSNPISHSTEETS